MEHLRQIALDGPYRTMIGFRPAFPISVDALHLLVRANSVDALGARRPANEGCVKSVEQRWSNFRPRSASGAGEL